MTNITVATSSQLAADGAHEIAAAGSNVAIPGAGLSHDERGHESIAVSMEYGGGIETLIGPGSVSVPGSLAAIELAWKKYGAARWESIFAPSIRANRDGSHFWLPSFLS